MNENSPEDEAKIVKTICWITALLLFCAVASLPYGYYVFLKIVVCGASCLLCYLAAQEDASNRWVLPWGAIVILFNPIIQIPASKEFWGPVDILVGLLFAYTGYKFRKGNEARIP